jgi:cyclic pyranopterin phosphate synthase
MPLGGFTLSDAPRLDRFHRPMENLRVSITNRCGMACEFCHAEGQFAAEDVVSPDQIETAVRVGAEFGIRQVKITGGEPTLRRELVEIVERARPWVDEVSMVTAGYTLPHLAGALADAGLSRVNISVHSPDDATHSRIMGAEIMGKVRAGIEAAKAAGLAVRLNMTVMKGVNDAHWEGMLKFCGALGVDLRFIEIHAPRHEVVSPYFLRYYTPIDTIERELASLAVARSRRPMHNRPEFTVRPEGASGPIEVEVVRPQFNPAFCAGCSRVRLTTDGKLKTCLLRRDDYIGIEECKGPTDAVASLVVTEESARAAYEKALKIREPYWKPGETLETVTAMMGAATTKLTTAQSGRGLKVVD